MQNSNFPSNGEATGHSSDEVDVFEVLEAFWRRRWIILFFMLVGGVLAGAFAFTAKAQWSSQALVTRPRVSELKGLIQMRRALDVSPKPPIYQNGFDVRSNRLSANKIADALFNEFVQAASMQPGLSVVTKERANAVPSAELRLSVTTEGEVQDKLVQAIAEANMQSLKQEGDDLDDLAQDKIGELRNWQEDILDAAANKRALRLSKLKFALNVAERAGIEDMPLWVQSNNLQQISSDSFLLGRKILSAQIDSLQQGEVSKPLEYHSVQLQIEMLKRYAKGAVPKQAFSYVAEPSAEGSGTRRWPSALILGILLGAMVGCGLVLIHGGYQKRRSRLGR